MRNVAILAGVLIIAATAHVGILASGGYAAPAAPLQIAVALGLCVGSICLGMAWGDRRWAVVASLAVALLAGEAFAVLTTAERTIAARDATAAPAREAEATRAAAVARVAGAEASKRAADASALSEAAKPGCKSECRKLIEGAKADARRELDAAQLALAALPAVRSSAPLAERLGLPAWLLDVIAAALASIAANGLGASLIAFGAHRAPSERKPGAAVDSAQPAHPNPAEARTAEPLALPAPTPRDHAARFGLDMLAPAAVSTPVVKLHSAYRDWCRTNGHEPFPAREIGPAMLQLFERSGLAIEQVEGVPHLAGARLKSEPHRALGPMATRA